MSDVKRYAQTYNSDDDMHYLEPDAAGDWVRHDDYAALEARLEAVTQERDALAAAKWNVQHTDTMNDMVQMGMARDEAISRAERAEAALATARRDAMEESAGKARALKSKLLAGSAEFTDVETCDILDAAIRALAQEEPTT